MIQAAAHVLLWHPAGTKQDPELDFSGSLNGGTERVTERVTERGFSGALNRPSLEYPSEALRPKWFTHPKVPPKQRGLPCLRGFLR